MGTPGKKWKVKKEQLKQAIIKFKGKITYVAADFKVTYRTARKKVENDPELSKLIDECLFDTDNFQVEIAENSLENIVLNHKTRPGTAFQAAKYLLDNKGQKRGFGKTILMDTMIASQSDLENKDMVINALKYQIEELRKKINDLCNQSKTESELPGSNTPI